MRDGDENLIDTDLLGVLAGTASDIHERLAAFLVQDLDIQPANALHKAGAQHFHDGFFGRPSPGKGFVAVLSFLAVANFFRRVDAVDERVGMTFDHLCDASNLDDICSESNDHRD